MNIQKIKKKYPYKETKAEILEILKTRSEEGYVPVYGKYQAIEDLEFENKGKLRSDFSDEEIYYKVYEYALNHNGRVKEYSFNDPAAEVYKYWYEYTLLVKYEDLDGCKHQNMVTVSNENIMTCGEVIDVCYEIDKPDNVVIKNFYTKTIEDYKRNLWCFTAGILFLITSLAYCSWLVLKAINT